MHQKTVLSGSWNVNFGLYIGTDDHPGEIMLLVYEGSQPGTRNYFTSGVKDVPSDGWSHIAVTYDKGSGTKLDACFFKSFSFRLHQSIAISILSKYNTAW